MKTIIMFAFIILTASAAPATSVGSKPAEVQILRYENDNIGIGGYNFGYETSDGVSRQESAQLTNAGSEQEALAIEGSYSWVAPDGQQYAVTYIANENGFQPRGGHLPN